MNIKQLFHCIISSMLLLSCSDEYNDLYQHDDSEKRIRISVSDFEWDAETRSTVTITEKGPVFTWATNDTISIYPDMGSQVEFLAYASESNMTTARFDGGAWELKPGHSFRGFYPFSFYNRSANIINLDYSGQIQTQNKVYSCQKDYIYTDAVVAESDNVEFTFKHLGIFLLLNLTMPEEGIYTSVSLCSTDSIFPITQTLDLTQDSPIITNKTKDWRIRLTLQDIEVTAADELCLSSALFLPAIDFTEKKVYVTATDNTGNRYTSNAPIEIAATKEGMAYLRTASMVKQGTPGYIDVEKYKISLLSIGNSYSVDALAYAPLLLQELLPNADIEIGIACEGGSNLQGNYNICNNNNNFQFYYLYSSQTGKWAQKNSNARTILTPHWDYITLQQKSDMAPDYNSYGYLANFIGLLSTRAPESKISWVLTHSYPDKYHSKYNNSDDMFTLIANAGKKVLDNYQSSINTLIPYGTAIQNARHTELTKYGDYRKDDISGQLCYTDSHLQAGIARLIASYSSAQSILNFYQIPCSINDCNLRISSTFDASISIPQPHGTYEEYTDEEYQIAKKCALKAIEKPYEIYIEPTQEDDSPSTPEE